VLAVTALAADVLAALEAEGDHLLALLLAQHFANDGRAGDERLAQLDGAFVAEEQHVFEDDLIADLLLGLEVAQDHVARTDGVLAAAVADDGVHGGFQEVGDWRAPIRHALDCGREGRRV
jgi:hypothetical protein